MLAVLDMIERENQKFIDIGRKEGKIEGKIEGFKEIARKLLNKNIPKEEISEITGLNEKEIDKIAKEK